MSLARSFTSRMRARFDDTGAAPNRAFSTKAAPAARDRNIDRRLISLPIGPVSTSNAQAYEAPDIKAFVDRPGATLSPLAPVSPFTPMHALTTDEPDLLSPALTDASASSASSTRSWEDSALASPALTAASSVTSIDGCSREPSPASCDPHPMSSTFFDDRDSVRAIEEPRRPIARPLASPTVPHTVRPLISPTAPAIPTRSMALATETEPARTVSPPHVPASPPRLMASPPRRAASPPRKIASPPPLSPTKSAPLSPSALAPTIAAPAALPTKPVAPAMPEDHPFGAELASVEELAEAFGGHGSVHVVDPETQELLDQGFFCFAATDYLEEIKPLFSHVFGGAAPPLPEVAAWI